MAGAQAVGLSGILVRIGKDAAGDKRAIDPSPAHVADDLAAAVDWILDHA